MGIGQQRSNQGVAEPRCRNFGRPVVRARPDGLSIKLNLASNFAQAPFLRCRKRSLSISTPLPASAPVAELFTKADVITLTTCASRHPMRSPARLARRRLQVLRDAAAKHEIQGIAEGGNVARALSYGASRRSELHRPIPRPRRCGSVKSDTNASFCRGKIAQPRSTVHP